MPPISLVTLESGGVALIYGRDEVAIEAAQRLADRLDITVLLSKPGDVTPRRTNEFPVLKGTIRNARGHLGAFELDDRRLCAAAAVVARQAGVRGFARRRHLDLRPDPRSHRRRAVVSRARIASRLSARRSARPRRGRARHRGGRRPGRHLRQAALHPLRSVAVRPFALRHHRLHALPRSLPDRRDHARRQCGRDRRQCLRRLRLLCLGLPDRRCVAIRCPARTR